MTSSSIRSYRLAAQPVGRSELMYVIGLQFLLPLKIKSGDEQLSSFCDKSVPVHLATRLQGVTTQKTNIDKCFKQIL
jgi:hypothetical protein